MTEGWQPGTDPERILIPRFDSLGDIVLLEGFLEALQAHFPKARLTLLVRRVYCDMSSLFPESLEWLATDIDPHRQAPDLSLCRSLLEEVGAGGWGLVLITAHNRTWAEDLVVARLRNSTRWAIGGEHRPSPSLRRLFSELQLGDTSALDRCIPVPRDCHEAEKYRLLWAAISGSESPLPVPRLSPNEYHLEAGKRILNETGFEHGKYAVCFPAGTQKVDIKAWPPDRFAEVIAWLEGAHGLRSLVAGHKSESERVRVVSELARERGAHPAVWTGRDGEIPLLASLLKSARLYVGNDTGPMHMSAALRIPVVAVFGGGTWPRFVPQGGSSLAIAGEMPCFGCGWECIFADAPCMRLPSVEDVQHGIDFILGASGREETGPTIRAASAGLSEGARDLVAGAVKTAARMHDFMADIEADREARLDLIEKLTGDIEVIEQDRAARLAMIQELNETLKTAHEVLRDTAARLSLLRRNFVVKVLLKLGLISGWPPAAPTMPGKPENAGGTAAP